MHEFLSSPAWGTGLATVTAEGQVLDTWYPTGRLGLGQAPVDDPGFDATLIGDRPLAGLRTVQVRTVVGSLVDPPEDAYDAYLRLHLLSHRFVRPHQAVPCA